jgi:hypothetical protein
MRRFVLAVVVIALALPGAATAANPPTTTTQHFQFSSVSGTPNPCTGANYIATYSADGVVHITTFADGSFRYILEETQTISFDPTEPGQPSYTGRAVATNQLNLTAGADEAIMTTTILLRGTDGSLIVDRVMRRLTITPTGFRITFDKQVLACP